MTIKQQGGVFGRNPTFNDVDASNVTTAGLTSETLVVDSSNPLVNITDRIAGTPYTSSLVQSGSHLYIDNKASGALRFRTATAIERLNIAAGGDVTVSTGNLVIGTSGKGIDFSATSGTGTSELFDDYEEGTWTPALTFLFGSAGITYANRYGFYTKVGNKVYVTATIQLSSKGTGSGNAYVNGLPFVSGNFSGNTHAFSLTSISNLTYTGQVDGRVYANAGFMYFGQTTEAGVNSNLTEANFANNTTVVLSGSYFV